WRVSTRISGPPKATARASKGNGGTRLDQTTRRTIASPAAAAGPVARRMRMLETAQQRAAPPARAHASGGMGPLPAPGWGATSPKPPAARARPAAWRRPTGSRSRSPATSAVHRAGTWRTTEARPAGRPRWIAVKRQANWPKPLVRPKVTQTPGGRAGGGTTSTAGKAATRYRRAARRSGGTSSSPDRMTVKLAPHTATARRAKVTSRVLIGQWVPPRSWSPLDPLFRRGRGGASLGSSVAGAAPLLGARSRPSEAQAGPRPGRWASGDGTM